MDRQQAQAALSSALAITARLQRSLELTQDSEMHGEARALRQQLLALQRSLANPEGDAARSSGSPASLQQQNEALKQDIRQLSRDLQSWEQQYQALKTENARLQQQLQARDSSDPNARATEAERNRLIQVIRHLQQENERLQAQSQPRQAGVASAGSDRGALSQGRDGVYKTRFAPIAGLPKIAKRC
jgi:SMC interacting uncharacterized protein involved in chromosome segregation